MKKYHQISVEAGRNDELIKKLNELPSEAKLISIIDNQTSLTAFYELEQLEIKSSATKKIK